MQVRRVFQPKLARVYVVHPRDLRQQQYTDMQCMQQHVCDVFQGRKHELSDMSGVCGVPEGRHVRVHFLFGWTVRKRGCTDVHRLPQFVRAVRRADQVRLCDVPRPRRVPE